MADEFDADSLESIDALLDEAALENDSDEAMPIADEVAPEAVDELDALDDVGLDTDFLDNLENGTEDDFLDGLSDTFTEAPVEPAPAPKPEPEPVKKVTDNAEQILEKRNDDALKNNKNELTVAEMDAIKKLIIIFSSVIIGLVLTGIGIGVWGALSSSSGLSEENLVLFEDIKAGTEQNTKKAVANDHSLKSIEKKLDALSFQMEQLNGDLVQLTMGPGGQSPQFAPTAQGHEVNTDPHAQNNAHGAPPVNNAHGAPVNNGHGQVVMAPQPAIHQPAAMPAPVVTANVIDPELSKKVDKVNQVIVATQRRIDDISKRLKQMQSQYQYMLSSVKVVEKEIISAKVAKEQAAEVEAKPQDAARNENNTTSKPEGYHYSSPGGMIYEQGNTSSYP